MDVRTISRQLRAAVAWIVVGCASAARADDPAARYDLLVRNGRIVDGTGNPWFYGDVAVRDGRIAAVGRVLEGTAERTIDARGLMVAPGFIDIHSHSDSLLLEDGAAQSKIRQGVTTEVLGEGDSAGPDRRPSSAAGRGDRPKSSRWPTLAAYFASVERSKTSVNVASYVGLNNVWRSAMGDSFERPTDERREEMRQLVDEAMRDGALGLSSQLMMPPVRWPWPTTSSTCAESSLATAAFIRRIFAMKGPAYSIPSGKRLRSENEQAFEWTSSILKSPTKSTGGGCKR